jgi:hypothetical protein
VAFDSKHSANAIVSGSEPPGDAKAASFWCRTYTLIAFPLSDCYVLDAIGLTPQ